MKITDTRTGKTKEVSERYGKILAKLPRYSTRALVAETAPKKRGRPPKVKAEVVTSLPPDDADSK